MSEIIEVGDIGELQDLIAGDGETVVLFTAPSWCVPCRQFAPHFKSAAQTDKSRTYAYVDIDNVPDAVVEYGIQGVPTTRLYSDGGSRDLRERTAVKFLSEVAL